MTQWGIWNYEVDGLSYHRTDERGRRSARGIRSSAGHHFRADELTDAVGTLLQPIIFGWDAYYVPSWTSEDFFLHVSHDGYVVVVTRTNAFHGLP